MVRASANVLCRILFGTMEAPKEEVFDYKNKPEAHLHQAHFRKRPTHTLADIKIARELALNPLTASRARHRG